VSKEKFNSVETLILFIFSLTLKIRRWPPLSPRGNRNVGGCPSGGGWGDTEAPRALWSNFSEHFYRAKNSILEM